MKKIITLTLTSSFLAILLWINPAIADENAYTIDGMIGAQPKKACWIIKQINEGNLGNLKNRVILHGPPGNGKTTLAHKIAELTKSHLLQLDGPSVVERYVGQGAQNIAELFHLARAKSDEGDKVTVFIDEVDAIAANNTSEFRSEHEAALQQLWLELDKCKMYPSIFVIFATNHLKKLSKIFLDRFGGNVIELKNPDDTIRTQIIDHYFKKAGIPLEIALRDQLVKKTKDLSIRCLEDLATDVHIAAQLENNGLVTENIVWDALKTTQEKFNNHVSETEKEKRLHKISTYVGIASGSLHVLSFLQAIASRML